MRENDSGHRTVGAEAPGDPDRDETTPPAGGETTARRNAGAGGAGGTGRCGAVEVGSPGDVVEAVAAFVDDLVEDGGTHRPGR